MNGLTSEGRAYNDSVTTRTRSLLVAGAALALLVAALCVPGSDPVVPPPANAKPFVWDQDARWDALAREFEAARAAGCGTLRPRIAQRLARIEQLTLLVADASPTDPALDALLDGVFEASVDVAACPAELPPFAERVAALRTAVKRRSRTWDVADPEVRARLYRLLYGGRAALEEALLQAPAGTVPALQAGEDEPSATPAATLLGATVHGGDILVSRGGAPTSALIARGNDFPGNFSHAALLHVDERTGVPTIVEALIERGLTYTTLDDYIRDKKLRVMVLRPRADLAPLAADPRLPHRAAEAALEQARTEHVPYDFGMDDRDHGRMFCAEVVSAAYERVGVRLWTARTHISSPGLARWLGTFGARQFDTQEPSDLEYDPQLAVVAEWRDPETLFKDHVDNAVTAVLLEEAERGAALPYARAMLPVARAAKAWSVILNGLGRVGPVPEGMDATAALRHKAFVARHVALAQRTVEAAERFRKERGFTPPYWELVRVARAVRGSGSD